MISVHLQQTDVVVDIVDHLEVNGCSGLFSGHSAEDVTVVDTVVVDIEFVYFLHDFEGEAVMFLGDDELVDVLLAFNLLLLEFLGYLLIDGTDPGLGLFVKDAQFRI